MAKVNLFRQEAIDAKQPRWHSSVIIASPPSLRGFAIIMFAALVLGILSLGTINYSKTVTLNGRVTPNKGVRMVYGTVASIITKKYFSDGQSVQRGEPLFLISSEVYLANGRAVPESAAERITIRRKLLAGESIQTIELMRSERKTAEVQMRSMEDEVASYASQMNAQQKRAETFDFSLRRAEKLLQAQVVTIEYVQQRQSDYQEQVAKLRELERLLSTAKREFEVLRASIESSKIREATLVSQLKRAEEVATQELSEVEAKHSSLIVSPDDGIATETGVLEGDSIPSGKAIALVVPKGADLQAELLVPSIAVGRMKVGDELRIRYKAFPHLIFGTYKGIVSSISETTVDAQDLYRVVLKLPMQAVTSEGKQFALRSGMLLDADITTDRRSLFKWLAGPLTGIDRFSHDSR